MILYVNGDSHTAAAEAVNTHGFAEDDGNLYHLGRQPHPDNLAVSWGHQLAKLLNFDFVCEAQSGGSNTRILRTTRAWLNQHQTQDVFLIIQWSTWEREEWLIDGKYYQVNSSGIDHVPDSHRQLYKHYISNIDGNQKTAQAHKEIWEFHLELMEQNIPHVFFNGNSDFSILGDDRYQGIPERFVSVADHARYDWGLHYIGPYDPSKTYDSLIRSAGISTVNPKSWHFGKDGHSFFARFMLQYITDNQIIQRPL